jgi:hypothetical protein
MTSQINYNNIDAAYPVAGQDNDSQGFRDNFNAIKTALTTASVEITSLQTYSAKTNVANDFHGNQVTGALLINNSSFVRPETRVTNNQDAYSVYAASGDYQIYSVNTNTTFVLDQWVSTDVSHPKYQKIRLEIIPRSYTNWEATTSTPISINFGPLGIDGTVKIKSPVQLPWTSTNVATSIWDIWSYDSGQTQFVEFVGTWT